MKKYRCKIRTMDESQKEQLEQLCSEIDIDVEITEILPVGQPSKIDEAAFRAKHDKYIANEISMDEMRDIFGLSRAGFYKRLKEWGLLTLKAHNDEKKATNQKPIEAVELIQQVESTEYTFVQEFGDNDFEFTDSFMFDGWDVGQAIGFDGVEDIQREEIPDAVEQPEQEVVCTNIELQQVESMETIQFTETNFVQEGGEIKYSSFTQEDESYEDCELELEDDI